MREDLWMPLELTDKEHFLRKHVGAAINQWAQLQRREGCSMTMTTPRIPPLPPAQWTSGAREVFAIMEGPAARENGSRFNAVLTLANHPELATAFLNYYKTLMATSTLPMRLREIVTLRIAWRLQSVYEWVQHVEIAKQFGIDAEHVAAVKEGAADSPLWSSVERAALCAVDQLGMHSQIDDSVWNNLSRLLNQRQLMELLFIIGTYAQLCWVFNAMGVQLEHDDG